MTEIILKPEAFDDLEAASSWYEEQRLGLGEEFLHEIDKTILRLAERPLMYADVFEGVRRSITKRFPYGIYFVLEDSLVVVLAVLHLARDSDAWKNRIL